MTQPFPPRHLQITPIPHPHPLPPPDRYKHRPIANQCKYCHQNKSILLPHNINPWCNPIISHKTHRIPNQNNGGDELPIQVTDEGVAYWIEVDKERVEKTAWKACRKTSPNQWILLIFPETLEEHGEGDTDEGGEEEPEDVFCSATP
jgi:hypothetical protein